MDRSLDEIIGDRPQRSAGGGGGGGEGAGRARPPPRRQPAPRAPRREEYPRDGVRKTRYDEQPVNIDNDWVHDRYEENRYDRRAPPPSSAYERPGPPARYDEGGAKLRVDNVHYELTEMDLRELFHRIGPVVSVRLLYDRMDRSQGTAFVTYEDPRDARDAIAEFNNCNANGQPIRITMMPTAPAASAPRGSLFDRVERPSRSLFDRIEGGPEYRDDSRDDDDRRRRRHRSDSPRKRPAPEHIDRYVPGSRRASRSPPRRRGAPRGGAGRRPGQRREDSTRERRPKTDDEGRSMVGGRPRKTADELDAEMADYWGKPGDAPPRANGGGAQNGSHAAAPAAAAPAAAAPADDDIDMIE